MNIRQRVRWIHGLCLLALTPLLGGCFTLEYSPDGTKILFVWLTSADRKGGLAVSDANGANFRMLPATDAAAFGHWSPDGERIAYATDRGLEIFGVKKGWASVVKSGICGESAWIDDRRIVAHIMDKDPRTGTKDQSKLVWVDLAQGQDAYQEILLEEGADDVYFLKPIPRTSGVLYYSHGDLYLAEFGESKRITTTGDVVGFELAADGNRVIYARKSKNAQYVLLSIYELDLKLRSGKRIAVLNNVAGVNPKPRTGPTSVEWVWFSNDFQRLLMLTKTAKAKAGPGTMFDEVYLVQADGSFGKRIVNVGPDSSGMMAVFSPDEKSATILSSSDTIFKLSRFDFATAKGTPIRSYNGLKKSLPSP